MQYAAQMVCLLRGRIADPGVACGGTAIIAVFTAIRLLQSATASVPAFGGLAF
jgi:hypothetical protein